MFQYPYSQLQDNLSSVFQGEVLTLYEFVFDIPVPDPENDSYKAVLRVSVSPYWKGLIEFNLELNGIPVMEDNQGKDVTINW